MIVTWTTIVGVVVGVIWTAVAHTLWQWVPIAAAIAVTYTVVSVAGKDGDSDGKPRRKKCC